MKQKRAKITGSPPSLTVLTPQNTSKTITAGKSTLLLGATLQDNSTWQSHLELGENALIPKIRRKKLGTLKYISKEAKLLLINGHLMSLILYLWAGTSTKYLQKIQVTLNNSARFITGKSKRTKTLELMASCNWMTIWELGTYHSLITT